MVAVHKTGRPCCCCCERTAKFVLHKNIKKKHKKNNITDRTGATNDETGDRTLPRVWRGRRAGRPKTSELVSIGSNGRNRQQRRDGRRRDVLRERKKKRKRYTLAVRNGAFERAAAECTTVSRKNDRSATAEAHFARPVRGGVALRTFRRWAVTTRPRRKPFFRLNFERTAEIPSSTRCKRR